MFGFGEDDLPDFLYACAHVAALRYARQAQPNEFYIRSVSLGLRASLYVNPYQPHLKYTLQHCSVCYAVIVFAVKYSVG